MKPLVLYLFGSVALALGAAAFIAHALWRSGRGTPAVALAAALAVLAGTLFLIGQGSPGFLGGLDLIVIALWIMAGPVTGLVLGILIGWIRGPAPQTGGSA